MLHSLTVEQRRVWRIPAALATVALMIVLPLLAHLIPAPGGVPLGARWLPIFYAPLVAIALFDVWVAAAASLSAPILNHWLTGMPAEPMVVLLTAELLCFSLIAALLAQRSRQLWWIGPAAYVLGKALAWLLVGLLPLGPATLTVAGYWNSLQLALPGLVALALIGLLAQRLQPDAA